MELQTDVPRIYAAGDAVPTLMLAPTAVYESRVVKSNIINPGSMPYKNKVVPRAAFTKPEVKAIERCTPAKGVPAAKKY